MNKKDDEEKRKKINTNGNTMRLLINHEKYPVKTRLTHIIAFNYLTIEC